MLNQNLKAVAFDLDDTLYSQKSFTLSGFRAAANYFGKHTGHASDSDVLYSELVALLRQAKAQLLAQDLCLYRGYPAQRFCNRPAFKLVYYSSKETRVEHADVQKNLHCQQDMRIEHLSELIDVLAIR